ncbi:MAG: hypothetical protein ABI551_13600 [Polyangiaceae bacterium]
MIRDLVGTLGAWLIYTLIWIFGRKHAPEDIAWLVGPLGGPFIGERAYEETAEREGLVLERHANHGGLVPDFDVLASSSFDPTKVDGKIRDFYENTPRYRLDTWASTYFPASIALWLLVTTISRKVDQLNFPLDGLDVALGMTSEIVLLKRKDESIRYTGWFRKLTRTGRVIYTGFYMAEKPPKQDGACVKVVFPMPDGNATVLLAPKNDEAGGFRLESAGSGFGDVGFYRVQKAGEKLRVWVIRTLHESFRLYVDDEACVRCEHQIRFLGFRVLTLHYRIAPKA